nr:MAG TPA_asm: Putative Holin-like Toxin (Hol-Tox) [Caudoviricetes sp.]
MAKKKEKPSWIDLANLIINFGLLVVAILALMLK